MLAPIVIAAGIGLACLALVVRRQSQRINDLSSGLRRALEGHVALERRAESAEAALRGAEQDLAAHIEATERVQSAVAKQEPILSDFGRRMGTVDSRVAGVEARLGEVTRLGEEVQARAETTLQEAQAAARRAAEENAAAVRGELERVQALHEERAHGLVQRLDHLEDRLRRTRGAPRDVGWPPAGETASASAEEEVTKPSPQTLPSGGTSASHRSAYSAPHLSRAVPATTPSPAAPQTSSERTAREDPQEDGGSTWIFVVFAVMLILAVLANTL